MNGFKNWLLKVKKAAGYIRRFFSIIWRRDKLYVLLLCTETAFYAVREFPAMFLTQASANALTGQIPYESYLLRVGFWLAVMLVSDIGWTLINSYSPQRRNRLLLKMTIDFSKKCLSMDYETLSSPTVLDKMRVAKNAVYQGFGSATWDFLTMIANVLVLLFSLSILASNDLLCVLVTVLNVLLVSFVNAKYAKKFYHLDREAASQNRVSDYYKGVCSDFRYFKDIRLFRLITPFLNKLRDAGSRVFGYAKKREGYRFWNSAFGTIVTLLSDLTIYGILGYKTLTGSLDVGSFFLCISALAVFKRQLQGITGWADGFIRSSGYMEDYFSFMDQKSRSSSGSELPEYDPNKPHVLEMRNVSFKYPGSEQYALKNVSVKLDFPSVYSVVGENGAGKSTFIKLLLGLYEPTEGEILLDGELIKKYTLSSYMRLLAPIFQDFQLFSFSIADNIAALDTNKQPDEIVSAAQKANIDDKIQSLTKGYDTTLYRIFDDTGVELSGGQQQKLAIARSVLKDADIFVLDEPTSALDPRAEYELFSQFHEITSGKSAIYISHRLSSTRMADTIICFQNGRISEIGSHEKLMESASQYAKMYTLQAEHYI